MLKPLFAFALFLGIGASIGKVYAASEGFGGNPDSGDLYWYCVSLGVRVPPDAGYRDSFCLAYSPDETLQLLEFQINISGESSVNMGCTSPQRHDMTSPIEGYSHVGVGDDEVVQSLWWHNVGTYSFYNVLRGFGDWEFVSYTPPAPPGGSGSTPDFGQTSGLCY